VYLSSKQAPLLKQHPMHALHNDKANAVYTQTDTHGHKHMAQAKSTHSTHARQHTTLPKTYKRCPFSDGSMDGTQSFQLSVSLKPACWEVQSNKNSTSSLLSYVQEGRSSPA
jgi:hypothetical protein